MPFDFLITWPVWVLATEDSVEHDKEGTAIGLKERPGFKVAIDGDKVRLVVFTDGDLADRYLRQGKPKLVKVSVDSPERFVEWLRSFANAGGTSVLFDPEPVGTCYSIGTVIAALERGPV